MRLTINCDMGEGFGLYRMGDDAALMPHIDLANVACGFHASDPSIMRATVRLAKAARRQGRRASFAARHAGLRSPRHGGVACGGDRFCHLPDRRTEGLSRRRRHDLNHVKPHGALYGMAARDELIAAAIAEAVRPFGVPLLGMAFTAQEPAYKDKGVAMVGEFYADLDYDPDGNLILSRVHDAVDPAKGRGARACARSARAWWRPPPGAISRSKRKRFACIPIRRRRRRLRPRSKPRWTRRPAAHKQPAEGTFRAGRPCDFCGRTKKRCGTIAYRRRTAWPA